MRQTWVSCLALAAACAISACGDGDGDGKRDDDVEEETNAGMATGPCKDDGKPCLDEYGAPICPVSTDYEGDDLALCEPADLEEGLLLHYGPKDYKDKDEVKKYLLPAYGEDENCVYVRTTNTKPIYVNRYHGRMRPYSHHLIVTIVADPPKDLKYGVPTSCSQGEAVGSRWLLGSQDPQIDLEVQGSAPGSKAAVKGDPEFGSGQVIHPETVLRLDMHYVNTTDKELLREGWVFLKTVPKKEVLNHVDMLTFFQGDIEIPANASGVKTAVGRCRVPSDRYLGMVTGHFHQFGTRFKIWHERDKEQTLIYDTRDWDVPGNAFYTKRIKNPKFDGDSVWAASSGYIELKEGDYVNFQCEYDNPSDSTVYLGELGKDQMCNVFGFYYPSDGEVWNCVCAGSLCF